MKRKAMLARTARVILLTIPMAFVVDYAWAHCDGLDGPVVAAAQRALATGNVNYALIWVQPDDESEVRSVFAQALAVRTLGAEARSLADRQLFETLVRLHRAGEGAPYTGLAPAGRDLGPAIPAADRALASGDLDVVEDLLVEEVRRGLRAHFAEARERRAYDVDDVAAGRGYVDAYVAFIHYVKGIHAASTASAEGHYPEPALVH